MEGLYTIKLLGKDRDVYFGMPAVEYIYNKIDTSTLKRIGKGEFNVTDVKTIAHFVYGGLFGGCERRDERLDVAFPDVYSEVERIMLEDEHKVLETIGQAFSESATVKYLGKKGGSKKK